MARNDVLLPEVPIDGAHVTREGVSGVRATASRLCAFGIDISRTPPNDRRVLAVGHAREIQHCIERPPMCARRDPGGLCRARERGKSGIVTPHTFKTQLALKD